MQTLYFYIFQTPSKLTRKSEEEKKMKQAVKTYKGTLQLSLTENTNIVVLDDAATAFLFFRRENAEQRVARSKDPTPIQRKLQIKNKGQIVIGENASPQAQKKREVKSRAKTPQSRRSNLRESVMEQKEVEAEPIIDRTADEILNCLCDENLLQIRDLRFISEADLQKVQKTFFYLSPEMHFRTGFPLAQKEVKKHHLYFAVTPFRQKTKEKMKDED